MKRCLALGAILALICVGCAGMRCPLMGERHMMGRGEMWGCCPMHCEMGMAMMKRTLVPTQDGGVALLMGKRLVKYDKDLNVQKEVELKCDPEGMRKMMEEMRAGCPMCKRTCKKYRKGWGGKHEEHEMAERGD